MTTRLVFPVALLLLTLVATSAEAQQYIPIPDGWAARDVTPDGEIVVGTRPGGSFVWRWRDDPAPTLIAGAGAVAVSDDGTVLAGTWFDPVSNLEEAARWTQATGWVSLGGSASCDAFLSAAYDISGDGSTIVGLAWDACSGVGFRWTAATGLEQLDVLANGHNRASTISGDGSTIGGFAQGTLSRTPAYWESDLTGVVLDPTFQGEVLGLSEDGSLSVGTRFFGGSSFGAFVRNELGFMLDLGSLNNGWGGNAADIDESGTIIAGYDSLALAREAWVWTLNDGIISLNDRLTTLGVIDVPDLHTCLAMSDDGNVIVGSGAVPLGGLGTTGFIVEMSTAEGPWEDIGGGTIGLAGAPTLVGDSTLEANAPFTLDLTNAPPNALMLAWVSVTSLPFNKFGGTIHAFPNITNLFLPANGAGEFTAATTWPAGVPAGTEFWFQFIVQDASVFYGKTLTNALKATTP